MPFEQTDILALFKTECDFAHGQDKVEGMKRFGLRMTALDRDAMRELELIVRPDIVGGIHYQEDAHLDPDLFVSGLAEVAQTKWRDLAHPNRGLGL